MESELYHHGVLGMQWGKHKASSKNININNRDYKKFRNYSAKKTHKMNKRALKIYSDVKKINDKKYEYYKKKTERAESKNSKKAVSYQKKRDVHKLISTQMAKKIDGINSGTIKAGQDFIVKNKSIKIPILKISPIGGLKIGVASVGNKSYIIEKNS